MNKKIFAALASATMALSATGSLAVFAEDFDVTTEAVGDNGTIGGIVIPNNGVAVNVENFPDKAFREGLISSSSAAKVTFYDKDDKVLNLAVGSYGDTIKKDDLEKVVRMVLPAGVENGQGVEFFTNLKVIETTSTGASSLETLDLTENKKLVTINLVNVPDLETLLVPATNTLENVIIKGDVTGGFTNSSASVDQNQVVGTVNDTAPIYQLDLSANKRLQVVAINGTLISKLDLSNNPYLEVVNVDCNKINSLDLTNNYSLRTVIATHNNLYNLDVPNTTDLTTVNVSHNILQEFDTTGLTDVQLLAVNNNELRTLDVTNLPSNVKLYLAQNHIAAIDLSDITGLTSQMISPQVLFVDSAYDAVNLVENVDDFDKSAVIPYSGTPTGSYAPKTGVYTLNKDSNAINGYDYKTGGSDMWVKIVRSSVMNRLYNPNSGEHFYTSDIDEKDALVKLGWQDEGIGWTAPMESKTPVYRLYNPNAGDHHYTTSSVERDTLVTVGWKYEGIGWYSYTTDATINVDGSAIPAISVYREYNPNAKAAGAHNYTVNRAENDFLVSVGWLDEGIAWYAMK